MDSLLLLCRVDAFLVRGSGMFVHSVRGCVRDCADCNCVGSAKSLHSKRSPTTTINWDLYTFLAGLWEDTVMDNVDEEYDHFVHYLRDSAEGAESLKTTKRRLSPETLD
ncbi:unnamed protein product [Heligmosomoides polygyrus]|uniref:Pre-mRNA-splicing factor 38 n=1 Tax=Heligmosomoides polygyrus TaxID=6339 RepID=A0A183FDF9_HELPZ|nr:unnamed protein product [Heligmosomoides polygyrus]